MTTQPIPAVTACPHDELAPPLPNEQLLDSHVVAQRALQAVRMPPLWSVYAACPFYIMATFIAMARSPLTSEENRRKLGDLVQWMCQSTWPTRWGGKDVWVWVPLHGEREPMEMLHPDGTTSYRPVSEDYVICVEATEVLPTDAKPYTRRIDFRVAPSFIDGLTLTPTQCSGRLGAADVGYRAMVWQWLTTPLSALAAQRVQDLFDKIYPGAERTRPHSPWHTAKSAVRELGNALGTDR